MNTLMMVMIAKLGLEDVQPRAPVKDVRDANILPHLSGTGACSLSPSGEPFASGIFASRLRDLARYGVLYRPSWNEGP